MVGLMTTSSKRSMAYAIPKSAAPRAHVPAADHQRPTPPQETFKHSSLSLYGVRGSRCTQGLFEPSERLWWEWGWILNVNLPFLPSCWGFFFALGRVVVVSFCGGIQHFPVNCCSSVSCNFGVLTGEDECMSF